MTKRLSKTKKMLLKKLRRIISKYIIVTWNKYIVYPRVKYDDFIIIIYIIMFLIPKIIYLKLLKTKPCLLVIS